MTESRKNIAGKPTPKTIAATSVITSQTQRRSTRRRVRTSVPTNS
jgi:hypothetical protein